MGKFTAVFFLLSIGVSQSAVAQTTLIYAGKLLAVPGQTPLERQSIVVEDGKITAIKPGYIQLKKADQVIDLKERFVLPGLMDVHVHLQHQLGPHEDSETLKMSDELIELQSLYYAKKTLQAGFTTVRDLGSDAQAMYALRDAIERGWVDGPRIVAAGIVGITGGHMDVSGMKPDLLEKYTDEQICDGPYECRGATRRAIKFGADWIKIASTGGVLTDANTGTGLQMEPDEIQEIVRAAKSMGRKVACHAHQEDGIIAALEAGVASIEHGTYTGERAIRLFKKTGAYLVPTLLAGDTVKGMAEHSDFMSEAIKHKAIEVGGAMQQNFAKAYRAGVKIAYGTDSGVSHHGDNAREAVLMVQAGMSPMEVIKAATVNAAELLDLSPQIGTIEVGKQADIIATEGSPLDNIKQLLDVDFVMKSGKVYKQK